MILALPSGCRRQDMCAPLAAVPQIQPIGCAGTGDQGPLMHLAPPLVRLSVWPAQSRRRLGGNALPTFASGREVRL